MVVFTIEEDRLQGQESQEEDQVGQDDLGDDPPGPLHFRPVLRLRLTQLQQLLDGEGEEGGGRGGELQVSLVLTEVPRVTITVSPASNLPQVDNTKPLFILQPSLKASLARHSTYMIIKYV